MNIKLKSIFALASLCAASFAQEPTPAPAADATPAPVAEAAPAPATEPVSAPAEEPVASPAEESVVEPVAAPAEEAVSPVAESAPASEPTLAAPVAVRQSSANSINPAPDASEDEFAPKAVRNGESSATSRSSTNGASESQPKQKIVYETVHMGVNGVPVRTIYVAESSPQESEELKEMMERFPMEFKIGVQGSVNSYYLSNDTYGSDDVWYSESFSGLSWRAGVVAIIPLNKTSMGVKAGVLYEQSDASESYYVNEVPTTFKFEQKKLDIPVLFTFKAPGSRLYFDLGAQVSIPLQDELKVSFTDSKSSKKVKSSMDMMDEDYRNSIDWSMVFGFSIMANKYVSLDLHAELGLSEAYEGYMDFLDLSLSSSSFGIGLTIYPF